jgi:lambda family phage minor tail protein L
VPIITDLQSLAHDAEIELFTLTGYNAQSPLEAFRFTNNFGVVQGGIEYLPIACAVEGIQYTGEGSLPRPKFVVADTQKILSGLVYFYDGIEGSTLRIHKTLKRYLDGQEAADPSAVKSSDTFVVSQCTQEVPGVGLEFELCAPIDFVDESVPARPATPLCSFVYRLGDCPYSGSDMFTINNRRTLDPKKDQCAKSVTACSRRFNGGKANGSAILPHGGFPSMRRFQ